LILKRLVDQPLLRGNMGAPYLQRQAFAAERGFTLVELLVVVLIVAILAAIALPSFLDQKGKSQDAEAKWMAAVAAQAMHIWHQQHGTFAGAGPDELAPIEPTIRTARGVSITDLSEDDFTVTIESAAGDSGGGPFIVEHRNGVTERLCDVPNRGGCPDSGRW
jgi:type IV pilus assembly protein PilA